MTETRTVVAECYTCKPITLTTCHKRLSPTHPEKFMRRNHFPHRPSCEESVRYQLSASMAARHIAEGHDVRDGFHFEGGEHSRIAWTLVDAKEEARNGLLDECSAECYCRNEVTR